jgi:hypothetical protein
MDEGKQKSITISDKINILVQVDAHIGTCVVLASHMRLSVPTLNTTLKKREEIERRYIHCAPFSKQWKSLKHLPLEKLESALAVWFKQTHESNAAIDGTHQEGLAHCCTPENSQLFGSQWIDRQI